MTCEHSELTSLTRVCVSRRRRRCAESLARRPSRTPQCRRRRHSAVQITTATLYSGGVGSWHGQAGAP